MWHRVATIDAAVGTAELSFFRHPIYLDERAPTCKENKMALRGIRVPHQSFLKHFYFPQARFKQFDI